MSFVGIRKKNNLVLIFTEFKLKGKIRPWIVNKFDGVQVFTSDLESGYLGADVMVIMNSSLAKHVCKVSKVPGRLLFIKLLFRNKLLVSILGLYVGASSAVRFFQAGKVNSFIAKAVNESSFIVLGGNFNENGSYKCASFKKCLDLGLVNSLAGSPALKLPTWANSRGVIKTIDYVFVSSNLINMIVNCEVLDISEHFNTDHQAVSMAVGLDGLLDTQLNSFCRQANRDCWKFDFKGADEIKWNSFKGATSANTTLFSDEFDASVRLSDLDAMWSVIHRIMIFLAGKEFNDVFTKKSLKFHKLELLVSKIIKASRVGCALDFASFMEHWASLDGVLASTIQDLVNSGVESGHVLFALLDVRKSYWASKLVKSQSAKEANIRSAISKKMKSFEMNKGHMIRSVLEHPFYKVVLDHLVVNDELILEPDLVKSKVNAIMKGWTRKRQVVSDISFFEVVSDLSDGKAAGLLGISNELWKHCDRSVLNMLLVLLNSCLSGELVSSPWKKAWISMISKPYEWKGVLMNTCPIALIETACKILSKILFDRISLACSTFNVLQEDNFLVLKDMTIQSPIFAIGSVVKDALEKNRELWLVLQDMQKAVKKSLVRIKMCSKFIWFFGSIYRDCTNQVMTDFGLTSGYCMHNGLDQREVFSPLLWCIFYDLLLYEVKRQESVYGYRLNSHFVSKNGYSESQAGFSSFFAAGAFVDNTIWVGSSQMATQHILNIASEFFCVNNISINNDKMITISINSRGLSKPSLVKAHSDVCFFTNLVLKKAVLDKQFLYLVSAVLYPIVSYRIQFSFVPVGMCNNLKLKSGLPLNFPNDVIHHPSFYGLKSFFQIQSESKIVSLVSFANSSGILGRLFFHRSHDLQVLCWCPIYPLSSPVHIRVSASNNFLAGMVHVLLNCNVSLGGSLVNSFRFRGGVPMSTVLSESRFFRFLPSLWQYGIAFHSVLFLDSVRSSHTSPLVLGNGGLLNILEFSEYVLVRDCLLVTGVNSLSVYTDGFLSNLGTVGCRAGTAVFFEDIGMSLGVNVLGLMSSTLMELQTIALALECVPSSSSVRLFSDIERHHIVNLICSKELGVSFHKVKGHSGVLRNKYADEITGTASFSKCEHFLAADGGIVSGNARHFICDIYHSVCCVHWEVDSGFKILVGSLFSEVDWLCLSLVWHLDLHMAMGFTSRHLASVHTYFMKALYYQLPVAVQKCLYNRHYPSVLCLYCGEIEVSDHLLDSHVEVWKALSGSFFFSLDILHLLSSCVSDFSVFMALFKSFVFNGWFREVVCVFRDPKIAILEIIKFVHSLGLAFREDVWSVRAKHHAYMEKNGLIPSDGSAVVSIHGLALRFSARVVKLLGVTNALDVHFGFCKSCLFFSGVGDSVSVHIDA
ncbi:hypothetical protein G9A89_013749 [Geosiphon pyriformis]|nr:hypothetical protein G9A89_013749 [Geosiphon pyriformis]